MSRAAILGLIAAGGGQGAIVTLAPVDGWRSALVAIDCGDEQATFSAYAADIFE